MSIRQLSLPKICVSNKKDIKAGFYNLTRQVFSISISVDIIRTELEFGVLKRNSYKLSMNLYYTPVLD